MSVPVTSLVSRSPQSPDDVVVEVKSVDASQVARLATVARTAQRDWWHGGAARRASALQAAAEQVAAASEELAALMVREVGKPIGEANGEVARAVAILRYYAQAVYDESGALHAPSGRGLLFSERRPVGIAGLITPWNFPLAIPVWKLAPALACGNAAMLKPAPESTACALRLAELLNGALPEGLVQVLPGGAETGRALIERTDVVSFTGSAAVGRRVVAQAAGRLVPVQAEMGGQNASIVLPDADLETAAAQVAAAAMGYAGQKCTATSRAIVVGAPAAFTEALVAAVDDLAVGDPADAATVVGPVITSTARDAVIGAAAQAPGRVIIGGTAPDRDGWYVSPTLVDGVGPDAPLATEEVFGPICAILPAPDDTVAVKLSNAVRYGLATAIFTRDLDRALAVVDGIDTGIVKVNAPTSGVDFWLPFGGEKESSYGPREQGKAARDFYTTTRTVTIAPHGA